MLTVNDSTITNNAQQATNGGGIYFDGSNGGSLTVTDSTIQNNADAGIYFTGSYGATLTVTGTRW